MLLKDVKSNIAKIKTELTKNIDAQSKELKDFLEKNKQATKKIISDIASAQKDLNGAKNTKAKTKFKTAIKKLEAELKDLGAGFGLLKGKEQYLNDVKKSVRAAVKSAGPKKTNSKAKPAATKKPKTASKAKAVKSSKSKK